jgi:hypothetical protein
MQLLVPFHGAPEDYHSASAERRMPSPESCPNCGSLRRLRFHGYYERYVSARLSGEALRVNIRRMRCRDCRLTTSLLPWFCLTYRLVRGESVARFLRGDGIDACDLQWQSLLASCSRRFESWLPELLQPMEANFGLSVGGLSSKIGWALIEGSLGSIATATQALVARCGITLLGRYRCHRPGVPAGGGGGDHKTLLFSSGTDPPR